ncbi:putative aldouronate transport system permease protein [Paenibacillus catalpae]|uniref:Putative aldouronate transport system permease protein n=1 Tax=Paenibacillus catalpae TaxID=1045775 RepID=A0A1I1SSN3_9BACL|nr:MULTISPECIES: carbohydrate ABC transporter permease [Paenibacillus]MCM3626735.1 carbohydrate ABC transporter permease [Paenibacillus glycanilyticus]SFD49342.1 putative aldouronate transport system permease protein [Paenibacillus catalpae]
MYRNTLRYRWFASSNALLLTVISILCILPLVHVAAVSFSSSSAATANQVYFWPVGFNKEAYLRTLDNPLFLHSLVLSVERTVAGTLLSMMLTVTAAYTLSRSFYGRAFYSWFFVFTMLFNGGLIPTYMVVTGLHLTNTLWALILPSAVNVFNTILMMQFFRAIPKELEEAAHIDGAGYLRSLTSIYLPLSLPSLATLSLFAMVWHWNSWFDGLIYMTDYRQYPLATFLQTIIQSGDMRNTNIDPGQLQVLSERTVRSAQILIGALPILIVYPFLQRFFVQGLTMGAVKE